MTYEFHEDSGHAWLQVERAEVNALGLAGVISHYSYQSADGMDVYLEEDCDLARFLDAKKAIGESVTPCSHYVDGDSPIRSYDRFSQS